MKTLAFAGALATSLLVATALTPVQAGDMTHERALNVSKEPHNWLLHHGNYEGWRFSLLKDIDTDTVKNLKVAFTVALGGYESGGRYKFGNLQAHSDRRRRRSSPTARARSMPSTSPDGRRRRSSRNSIPAPISAWAGDVACYGVNNRGVALWKAKSSRSRSTAGCSGSTRRPARSCRNARWRPRHRQTLTLAPLMIRDIAHRRRRAASTGIRGWINGTDLNAGKQVWRTYTMPGPGGRRRHLEGRRERCKSAAAARFGRRDDLRPETDTFYQGIGDAGPTRVPEYRPGDDKWAHMLALQPSNDKIEWASSTPRTIPYDYDEIPAPDHQRQVNGEDRELVVHAAQRLLLRARPHQRDRFILGKQYVDH